MREHESTDANSVIRDAIDKHPVSTGTGAAVGLAAGAIVGSVVGPVGTVVGAVIGTVTGAAAGDAVAERIDCAAEETYWRTNHHAQPYPAALDPFEEYAPAYRIGSRGYRRGMSFDDREAELRMEYEGGPQQVSAEVQRELEHSSDTEVEADPSDVPGTMQFNMSTGGRSWREARDAARAAYERVAHHDVP
jgi:uncharacterized protein YcfJ